MGTAVGILFLAVLCAEIVLFPVWADAISISDIARFQLPSSRTPMDSSTSKTFV